MGTDVEQYVPRPSYEASLGGKRSRIVKVLLYIALTGAIIGLALDFIDSPLATALAILAGGQSFVLELVAPDASNIPEPRSIVRLIASRLGIDAWGVYSARYPLVCRTGNGYYVLLKTGGAGVTVLVIKQSSCLPQPPFRTRRIRVKKLKNRRRVLAKHVSLGKKTQVSSAMICDLEAVVPSPFYRDLLMNCTGRGFIAVLMGKPDAEIICNVIVGGVDALEGKESFWEELGEKKKRGEKTKRAGKRLSGVLRIKLRKSV